MATRTRWNGAVRKISNRLPFTHSLVLKMQRDDLPPENLELDARRREAAECAAQDPLQALRKLLR